MPCLAAQSAASRSGCRLVCFCWRLRSPGGWEIRVIASGAVRPSSSAQLWMWGQSRCPSCRSGSAVVSARTIAVMALLRSRVWPGSQDTSHWCWRPGAGRAVWAVRSLVMAVSLMVKVMAVTSGSGSWFGFQVGLGVAVAVLAGVQGVPQVGSGGREVVLDPVAGADDDYVVG